jgi:hypothetical protein
MPPMPARQWHPDTKLMTHNMRATGWQETATDCISVMDKMLSPAHHMGPAKSAKVRADYKQKPK